MRAFPGFLSRNWTLKLSAFGIALLLWVSVRVEAPNRQAIEGIPVRVDLTDPAWAVGDGPEPPTATVQFAGPSRELIRVAVDRPSIVIPVDRVGSADTTVVLGNQHVRALDGVGVDGIQPETVQLRFEPIDTRELPVAARLDGQLPEEWALAGPPDPEPGSVRVTGGVSRIQALDSIRLVPVPLGEMEGPGRYTTRIDTTGLAGLQVDPAEIQVELALEERVERALEGVPVVLVTGSGGEEFEVEPATGTVVLSGAGSLVEEIGPTGLRLVVEPGDEGLPEAPGEERVLGLRLEGVPDLLRAVPALDEVTVRRREVQR